VPAPVSFEFAIIRVVPRVERGEFINAGVMVFCLSRRFLGAKVGMDSGRLLALWPEADVELIREHLDAFPRVCAGGPDAGPIGMLSLRERFHWLAAPRSTIVQISPVHSGLCEAPEETLSALFGKLVSL